MTLYLIAMTILGLARGSLDFGSVAVAPILLVAGALQVWRNPEIFVPQWLREQSFYRRHVIVEYILTSQAGVLAFGLGFVAARYGRHLISN
jgi:hypothetical protein